MKIVIAGGSGFLGRALADALASEGQEVVVLSRRPAGAPPVRPVRLASWNPTGETGPWAAELSGATAVVNLAGESIAARRWSSAQKQRILHSRLGATRSLVAGMRAAARPPQILISGSAVGFYGPLGSEIVTEEHASGSDFLADVCRQWETEAVRGADVARIVCLRTGLVLEQEGGALPRMLLPFKLGAGGPLGSGRQYWPWIHRDDWVALVRWAIVTASASGPINATAPSPITNAEFSRALGRALHRPAFMPTPAFALRAALGEMADALLLSGQRALPEKAEHLGFRFRFTQIDEALRAIFRR